MRIFFFRGGGGINFWSKDIYIYFFSFGGGGGLLSEALTIFFLGRGLIFVLT